MFIAGFLLQRIQHSTCTMFTVGSATKICIIAMSHIHPPEHNLFTFKAIITILSLFATHKRLYLIPIHILRCLKHDHIHIYNTFRTCIRCLESQCPQRWFSWKQRRDYSLIGVVALLSRGTKRARIILGPRGRCPISWVVLSSATQETLTWKMRGRTRSLESTSRQNG